MKHIYMKKQHFLMMMNLIPLACPTLLHGAQQQPSNQDLPAHVQNLEGRLATMEQTLATYPPAADLQAAVTFASTMRDITVGDLYHSSSRATPAAPRSPRPTVPPASAPSKWRTLRRPIMHPASSDTPFVHDNSPSAPRTPSAATSSGPASPCERGSLRSIQRSSTRLMSLSGNTAQISLGQSTSSRDITSSSSTTRNSPPRAQIAAAAMASVSSSSSARPTLRRSSSMSTAQERKQE